MGQRSGRIGTKLREAFFNSVVFRSLNVQGGKLPRRFMSTKSKSAASIVPSRRSAFVRRWRRRLIVVVVFLVVSYAFRGSILPALAGILIAEDEPASATRVAILNGDRRYDRAESLLVDNHVEGI